MTAEPMLRILHILPSLSPETGGPSKSAIRLAKGIAEVGNDVSFYSTMWPRYGVSPFPRGDTPWADKDVKITLFPAVPIPLNVHLPHSPSLLTAVRNHGREFDMVIIHGLWNPLATFAMRWLRMNKLNYCTMPHGMLDPVVITRNRWKKLPWSLFWERANIEQASTVVFNSNAEENKARQSGWHLGRTFVMPHTIELSSWKDLPSRQDFEVDFPEARLRKVILFVGRINWVKNLDKLVDALQIVTQKYPAAMLVCVGPDGDGYRGKIERYAQARGLGRHILFTGLLEGRKLKAAYARGDVLALVSQKENFGLAAAEALACGLPVVVSNGVDVARDWPSEGPVRRVTPTPKEIAKALIELLEHSAKNGLPDPDARLMAERKFSFSRISELLDVWQSYRNQRA